MKWFDGTFTTTMEKIETEYPVIITEDLRATADNSRIAIISIFPEEDSDTAFSGPDLDNLPDAKVFFHIFRCDDAIKARGFITQFIETGRGTQAEEIDLFCRETDGIIEYGYGEIPIEHIGDQEVLKSQLPAELKKSEVFVLPLKVFMYPCPVCGKRTLQWRGMFDICVECGWEDDGEDNEDEVTSPNGDYTIRTYRNKYLKLKQANPDYKWWNGDHTTKSTTAE